MESNKDRFWDDCRRAIEEQRARVIREAELASTPGAIFALGAVYAALETLAARAAAAMAEPHG